jgi:FixJ family two-component response regulator
MHMPQPPSIRRGHEDFVIFLIDDDRSVLSALSRLFQAGGYQIKAYSSAEKFLDEHDPSIPGCIILDLWMPGLNGLETQQSLAHQAIERPIIFLTGQGNVDASVAAMKAGAVDFLFKPINQAELFDAVERAKEREFSARAERRAIRALFYKLTRRETQTMFQMVAGRLNKQIAEDLGIDIKTIKVHRSRVMGKMGVRSIAELVQMSNKISLQAN